MVHDKTFLGVLHFQTTFSDCDVLSRPRGIRQAVVHGLFILSVSFVRSYSEGLKLGMTSTIYCLLILRLATTFSRGHRRV